MPLVSTVLCLVFLGGSALAATQSGSTVETTANVGVTVSRLRLGLGGFGRVGCWIPIHIEATGFASGANVQVLVIASDARGDQCEDTVSNVKADTSGSSGWTPFSEPILPGSSTSSTSPGSAERIGLAPPAAWTPITDPHSTATSSSSAI